MDFRKLIQEEGDNINFEDIDNKCHYDNTTFIYNYNNLSPKETYSDKLRLMQIDENVIHEFEIMIHSKDKIPKITNEQLCAIIIQIYIDKGISYDIYTILNKFNIVKKGEVFSAISGTSTKQSRLPLTTAIPCMVFKPIEFVPKIMNLLSQYNIILGDNILYNYIDDYCKKNQNTLQKNPLEMACALTYKFLEQHKISNLKDLKIILKSICSDKQKFTQYLKIIS